MNEKLKKSVSRLVQDHKIQAGIGLAVALGVWHFKGHEKGNYEPIYKVGEVIDVLKNQDHIVLSDQDSVLHFDRVASVAKRPSFKCVSRVAYIAAVVVLAANAVDIQHQISKHEPPAMEW